MQGQRGKEAEQEGCSRCWSRPRALVYLHEGNFGKVSGLLQARDDPRVPETSNALGHQRPPYPLEPMLFDFQHTSFRGPLRPHDVTHRELKSKHSIHSPSCLSFSQAQTHVPSTCEWRSIPSCHGHHHPHPRHINAHWCAQLRHGLRCSEMKEFPDLHRLRRRALVLLLVSVALLSRALRRAIAALLLLLLGGGALGRGFRRRLRVQPRAFACGPCTPSVSSCGRIAIPETNRMEGALSPLSMGGGVRAHRVTSAESRGERTCRSLQGRGRAGVNAECPVALGARAVGDRVVGLTMPLQRRRRGSAADLWSLVSTPQPRLPTLRGQPPDPRPSAYSPPCPSLHTMPRWGGGVSIQ